MDIEKTSNIASSVRKPPLLELTLWPNRSLTVKAFVILIVTTVVAMTIPIIPLFGTKTIFVILPFSLATVISLFVSLIFNYRSGKLYEKIIIWPHLIKIKRYETDGTHKEWKANPYWTKVKLYKESQKIQNYLTLSGGGREVELGAFLAPNERLELKHKIDNIFRNLD